MANKLITQMGLPQPVANAFSARNMPPSEMAATVAQISEIAFPPYQTALSLLEERSRNECSGGQLRTLLKGLDRALGGGIPPGMLTELVGSSNIGNTQDDRDWRKKFFTDISIRKNGTGDTSGRMRMVPWVQSNNHWDVLCLFLRQRYIKVAKSPFSPPLVFPFEVDPSGILLLNDDGS